MQPIHVDNFAADRRAHASRRKQAATGGYGAQPSTRTPNPLIIGLIYSTLLLVARNPFISRGLAALWHFVATARLATLRVESRPVTRAGFSTRCAACGVIDRGSKSVCSTRGHRADMPCDGPVGSEVGVSQWHGVDCWRRLPWLGCLQESRGASRDRGSEPSTLISSRARRVNLARWVRLGPVDLKVRQRHVWLVACFSLTNTRAAQTTPEVGGSLGLRPSRGPSVFARSDSFEDQPRLTPTCQARRLVRCTPLTTSMPWAGVASPIQAARRLSPYPQGVSALLVVAGWPGFGTVVTGGSLPKSSHSARRPGGLPSLLLLQRAVARARVWIGGLAGTDPQSGIDRGGRPELSTRHH